MKIFLIAIVISLGGSLAADSQAQLRDASDGRRRLILGIQAGTSASILRFSDDCHRVGESIGVQFQERYSPNFHIGGIADAAVTDRIFVRTGLQALSKGWRGEGTQTDPTTGFRIASTDTFRMYYVQAPLLVSVQRGGSRIGAGLYYGYAFSAKFSSSSADTEAFRVDLGDRFEDTYSSSDYGYLLEFGYGVSRNVEVYGQLAEGLANQIPRQSVLAAEARGLALRSRHRALSFGMSYTFR